MSTLPDKMTECTKLYVYTRNQPIDDIQDKPCDS